MVLGETEMPPWLCPRLAQAQGVRCGPGSPGSAAQSVRTGEKCSDPTKFGCSVVRRGRRRAAPGHSSLAFSNFFYRHLPIDSFKNRTKSDTTSRPAEEPSTRCLTQPRSGRSRVLPERLFQANRCCRLLLQLVLFGSCRAPRPQPPMRCRARSRVRGAGADVRVCVRTLLPVPSLLSLLPAGSSQPPRLQQRGD